MNRYMLVAFTLTMTVSAAGRAQSSRQLAIDNDYKPVWLALRSVSALARVSIDYEEPVLEFEGDTEELGSPSDPVRRIIERKRSLRINYDVLPDGMPTNLLSILRDITSPAGDHTATYKIVQRGAASFQVIPTMIRDIRGGWVPYRSPLDAIVSLPMKRRSGEDIINSVLEQVSSYSNVEFKFFPKQGEERAMRLERFVSEVSGERARDVMTKVFNDVDSHYSWAALCLGRVCLVNQLRVDSADSKVRAPNVIAAPESNATHSSMKELHAFPPGK